MENKVNLQGTENKVKVNSQGIHEKRCSRCDKKHWEYISISVEDSYNSEYFQFCCEKCMFEELCWYYRSRTERWEPYIDHGWIKFKN